MGVVLASIPFSYGGGMKIPRIASVLGMVIVVGIVSAAPPAFQQVLLNYLLQVVP